jgi:8-oxo-dGTP pyrophosphatase MutT (NUDIX family)
MNTYSKNNNTYYNRKRIIRDISCTNCGSRHHIYKSCSEPVTSWGVILVTYGEMNGPTHHEDTDLSDSGMMELRTRVLIESNMDRFTVSKAYYNIKFLMISRKHSVGYVEFIRGRYRPERIDQVIYLFKQMMQSEIDKINYSLSLEKGFDYLWKDFWGNKAESSYRLKEKIASKNNYDMLKVVGVEGPEINLKYIVSMVKAEYEIEEWGFPKGRKDRVETEEECAIREFKEETGYTDDDFKIIYDIKPLVEELTGTNGIKYRHVYYVAEFVSNKNPQNNITEFQRYEVGNVQFMDFTTALECIREYHISRKVLLEKLFTYYLDRLVIANRDYSNKLNEKSLSSQNDDSNNLITNVVYKNKKNKGLETVSTT